MPSTKCIANTKMRAFFCTFECEGFRLQTLCVRLSTAVLGAAGRMCLSALLVKRSAGTAFVGIGGSWSVRHILALSHTGDHSTQSTVGAGDHICTPDAFQGFGCWDLLRGSAPLGLALGRYPGLNTHQQPWQSSPAPESSPSCFSSRTIQHMHCRTALSRPCSWGWVGEPDTEMHCWPKSRQQHGKLQWVPAKRCMSSLPCRVHLYHCPEMKAGRCFCSNATEMTCTHKGNITVSQKLFTLIH